MIIMPNQKKCLFCCQKKIYNDYIIAKQSLQTQFVALPRFYQNIGYSRDSNGNLMKTSKAKKNYN